MAQIYDLQAIREQTRRVVRDPQHLQWITPPSPAEDSGERLQQLLQAYRDRHPEPPGAA